MSVNPLNCSLSVWTGLEGYCHWCNNILPLGNKRWCSGNCLSAWRTQHRYYLSRQAVLKRARGKCACLRSENEPRHVLCAHCGACESVVVLRGVILTCDHIIPRNGDKSRFSCKHHQSNLQILCKNCHDEKSKIDELF